MNKFSLKALGATLLAVGLTFAGAASPSQAASMSSISATTTSTLTAGQVIANDIVISFTAPTAVAIGMSTQIQVILTNTTGFGADSACGARASFTSTPSIAANCRALNIGGTMSRVYLLASAQPGFAISANNTFQITIAGGTLTQVASGPISVTARTVSTSTGSSVVIDTSAVDVNAGNASATVTFDANGGTGTTAAQTASAATALTSNGFSRSGYTFAGWNTAADGSGTVYADGASYAFSSSTTLYAQWTPALASTGFDAAPYLASGVLLALAGAVLLLIARRRKTI